MSDQRAADITLLKRFMPLVGMKQRNLASLASKVFVRRLEPGRVLFKEGDIDKRTYWVVSGSVEIRQGNQITAIIQGGSADAAQALPSTNPRSATARALDGIEYLAIDTELLDVMITWDQTGTYEVAELQQQLNGVAEDDWMTTLLQNRVLQRLPPEKLQALFMRFERIRLSAGDVIVQQGAEGDYFYAIVSGRALVTRETPLNNKGIRLAELGPSDTLGEEALIAEARRNATVRMLSDGMVMRLPKADFRELLTDAITVKVDFDQAQQIVAHGGRWLDVRLPSEYQGFAFEGSLNIPLYFLRLKMSVLQPDTRYVVYCDNGLRSAAAAFILAERGIEACVLRDGLSSAEPSLVQVATG